MTRMQEKESAPNLETGLLLSSVLGGIIGSTILISALLLCACFKRTKRGNVNEEHKNGHIFGTSRHSSALDAEYDEDGLKGARATSHRRLPDLPDPLLNGSDNAVARLSSVRSSQDTSSELYAQVEIGAIANSFPVNTNPTEDQDVLRISVNNFNVQEDETSETHPYDKVKSNHGYSKIKKKAENPYAKVKRSDTMESEPAEADENETDTDNYDVVYTVHNMDETKKSDSSPGGAAKASLDNISPHPPPLPFPLRGSHTSLASGESGTHGPRPPPRGRRGHSIVLSHSSSNGNIHRPNSLISSEQDVTGPDALDGAGAVQNDIPQEARGAGAAQIHFSGDSQTSQDSKGYSSISVREPLANLKALNPGGNVGRQRTGSSSHHRPQHDSLDPHYATVSDAEDSDEMYAAIAELQPIYDSGAGSDTYAKINDRSELHPVASASGIATAAANPPLVVSGPTSPVPYLLSESEQVNSPLIPPTPPSVVSLKQLSTGSSRLHASTLSIASQTSGVGSPKPEKRQANSPLPPTPIHMDMGDSLERSRKSMNVEEMYAKVMKKKGFSMHPWQMPAGDPAYGKTPSHRGSVDLGFLVSREGESFSRNSSRRNSMDSAPPRVGVDVYESGQASETAVQEVAVAVVEEDEDEEEDFRYEMLPAPRASNRKISENDPGYERIQLKSDDSFNDPRYERIQLRSTNEIEPNYEVVGFRGGASESSEPGYEVVALPAQGFNRQDPNYESLHYSVHQITVDPPYASIAARDPDVKEEIEVIQEETTTDLVVNNNTVGIPVYAQVVKSKRAVAQTNLVAVVDCAATTTTEMNPIPSRSIQTQDFSVSSSKNTTIIRITDNRPSVRYFNDDDTFGVPEQV